jgi:branched-chain amino acid transport system permease protein
LLGALQQIGVTVGASLSANTLMTMKLSQVAPILPYLFLVLILIFRPKGLLGNREG